MRADQAYVGAPFRLNRAYAETFGDSWLVLSAKYGFVRPDDEIPGLYEVTFKRATTGPISIDALRRQIREWTMTRYSLFVVLGGRHYQEVTRRAFDGLPVRLVAPFAGLPIGKMMQATKLALVSAEPGFDEREASYGDAG